MKTTLSALVIGMVGGLSLAVFDAEAHMEVSASVQINAVADFHAPLEAHGGWIVVGSYGRCWRPAHVAWGWRPYCDGQWVWTDCGWYWDSDEPWAWACYHYGGWVYDSTYGWVWVPGIEWAPAWVSWRVGAGYIGWAPLGPGGVFIGVGAPFVFVNAIHFHHHVRPSMVIVNNTTIINKTTQITDMKRGTRTFEKSGPQKVIINEGPGVAVVQKATGQQIKARPIREVVSRTAVPSSVRRTAPGTSAKEKGPVVNEPPKARGQQAPDQVVPAPKKQPDPVPSHPKQFRQPTPPGKSAPSRGGPPGAPPKKGKGGGHGGHGRERSRSVVGLV